jgi:hypothetical protein
VPFWLLFIPLSTSICLRTIVSFHVFPNRFTSAPGLVVLLGVM